jgi:hypothetical protein
LTRCCAARLVFLIVEKQGTFYEFLTQQKDGKMPIARQYKIDYDESCQNNNNRRS